MGFAQAVINLLKSVFASLKSRTATFLIAVASIDLAAVGRGQERGMYNYIGPIL